jgi:hypothetical protein
MGKQFSKFEIPLTFAGAFQIKGSKDFLRATKIQIGLDPDQRSLVTEVCTVILPGREPIF